jgi:hypothetical protein
MEIKLNNLFAIIFLKITVILRSIPFTLEIIMIGRRNTTIYIPIALISPFSNLFAINNNPTNESTVPSVIT